MKKYCYCNHCGTKNKIDVKKCVKCNQKLKIKNHPLTDYLLDQTKDDVKSSILDTVFDKIKYLIRKYLYGIVMTITIIGGVFANVIVRADVQVVTEKPNITFKYKEYKDVPSIYNDMVKYLKNADEAGLKSLLFETHYREEASSLGINVSDNIIFTLTRDGVFKNNYSEMNEMIVDDITQLSENNRKYCEPSGKRCVDMSNNDYNVYNYYLLVSFYANIGLSDDETFADNVDGKTFFGKDDFDLFFVEVDGNYYLLDITVNHYDEEIAKAKGDLSLVDYKKQVCHYVGGSACEGIVE